MAWPTGQHPSTRPWATGRREIYFDAQATPARAAAVRQAIAAGKHVYTEKPLASSLAEAMDLVRLARGAGVRGGVVADKLFLPGMLKLKRLADGGFFGRILSVRGEFGYWVFDGRWQPAQRPSWNYRSDQRRRDHPGYVPALAVPAGGNRGAGALGLRQAATHLPLRRDENGQDFQVTADDAAYAIFELNGGVIAQVNSSWAVRVHRDELAEFQVDGTDGSAVAGLHRCRAQHRGTTPRPSWNPDHPTTEQFRSQWQEVPDNREFDNCFLTQWALFLEHVVTGSPYRQDLLAGARGVQLAELGMQSGPSSA